MVYPAIKRISKSKKSGHDSPIKDPSPSIEELHGSPSAIDPRILGPESINKGDNITKNETKVWKKSKFCFKRFFMF